MPNIVFHMWNKLWLKCAVLLLQTFCSGEYRRFQQGLAQPEIAQRTLLKQLLYDLARTHYGQQHKITEHENYESFAAKLPIQTYETLEPWIQEQIVTGQPIVSPHRIIHIEPTSGSSGPVKRIPYTAPLLRAFSNMFRIWAYDQIRYGFKPESGRIFMSISPPTGDTSFSDEREYLREPLRSLVSPFLVLPPKNVTNDSFHHHLALTLLQETKLEIISIWSPSYLLVLLDYIQEHREILASLLPPQQRCKMLTATINWQSLWPNLKLISCWDNALSEPLANQLRSLFPNVPVQGKGLLATEAPITVPLVGSYGHLPLIDQVFLEFETAEGHIKRLHELKDGEQAQVIVTQRGGLTRYRLNDLVEVRGFHQNTPSLIFIGRMNQVCDLAGEKLNDSFVCQALLPLMPSGYFLLIPYQQETELGYILFTNTLSEHLAEKAEQALCQAYHYQLARKLGQIAPLQTIHLSDLLPQVLAFHQAEGMRLGNIKDTTLVSDIVKAKRLLSFLNENPNTVEQQSVVAREQNTPQSLVH